MAQKAPSQSKSAESGDAAPQHSSGEMARPAASTGPDVAPKDGAAGASEAPATAAAYSTRSRNRANARPNYAEDSLDTDMFDDDDKKEQESKKSRISSSGVTPSNLTHEPQQRLTIPSAKKGAPPQDEGAVAGSGSASASAAVSGGGGAAPSSSSSSSQAANSKEPATASALAPSSASSAPAANGSQLGSKKRKATSQSAQAAVPSQPAARRSLAVAATAGGGYPDTNMMTFTAFGAIPGDGRLIADDGTTLEQNDHVYLVCEPPGEPYYLGRIMEFLHVNNDPTKPVDALRINWYYRPKDIGRKVNDTRALFATMHSDINPLTALRGKCQIRHRAEIANLDEYRKTTDCFWFEKLYDRYIQKNYDLIPTKQIVNVPERVKKVLDERWRYILVEQGRGKELTSAVKSCKRCSNYCASNDSVDCAVCKSTYHMNCVKPPLLKKPSRGFAWSCAACSRAQERKLEARNTPNVLDLGPSFDEEELYDDEEEDHHQAGSCDKSPPPDGTDKPAHQATAEQVYQASLWPYRYLGIHCKVEDALDYDDRIYPRASTRIGPRHQAMALPWPGRPVQYEKPLETKKPGKREGKLSKEAQAALEAEKLRREKRPKWIQDEPPGYIARGEDLDADDPDCTATLLWSPPGDDVMTGAEIKAFYNKALKMADSLNLPDHSTNLQDAAVSILFRTGFDGRKALKLLPETKRAAFNEPELSSAEKKLFEEAVGKYGSEPYHIYKHVGTLEYGTVVRYYYTWKKTSRGRQIWGNYAGRKGKKEAKKAEAATNKIQDDVADDHDDSAFDASKAADKKKSFICKFCAAKSSRSWRRAPNSVPGVVGETSRGKDKTQYIAALCRRCAELWRRYAIQWEDLEEMAKKVAQAGGRAWKRRQDEELLKELQAVQEMMVNTSPNSPEGGASTPVNGPSSATPSQSGEPPRKKLKASADKEEKDKAAAAGEKVAAEKAAEKAVVEKPPPPPPPAPPEIPKAKLLPCSICQQMEPMEQHLTCRECRMAVHRSCYGVVDVRNQGKWICDTCVNDKNPQASIHYKCVLCPVESTEHDFVEMPKPASGKKKPTEKDKERERLEIQQARKTAEYYQKRQEELNRPANPREPLKRTADNNWVHVTCAVWTPEVRFGNSKTLWPAEGIPSIARSRYDATCSACSQEGGATVPCQECGILLHVECARQHGWALGFDIVPIKGSKRDQASAVTINGDSGSMSAAVWCRDHGEARMAMHEIHEVDADSGLNALQIYTQNCKQADLTLTGTVRKANLITTAAKTAGPRRAPVTTTAVTAGGAAAVAPASPTPSRLGDSLASNSSNINGNSTTASATATAATTTTAGAPAPSGDYKICITCGIDVSPRWRLIDATEERELTNGHHGTLSAEAQRFIEQRKWQCHKCHKVGRRPRLAATLEDPVVLTEAAVKSADRSPPLTPPYEALQLQLQQSSPPPQQQHSPRQELQQTPPAQQQPMSHVAVVSLSPPGPSQPVSEPLRPVVTAQSPPQLLGPARQQQQPHQSQQQLHQNQLPLPHPSHQQQPHQSHQQQPHQAQQQAAPQQQFAWPPTGISALPPHPSHPAAIVGQQQQHQHHQHHQHQQHQHQHQQHHQPPPQHLQQLPHPHQHQHQHQSPRQHQHAHQHPQQQQQLAPPQHPQSQQHQQPQPQQAPRSIVSQALPVGAPHSMQPAAAAALAPVHLHQQHPHPPLAPRPHAGSGQAYTPVPVPTHAAAGGYNDWRSVSTASQHPQHHAAPPHAHQHSQHQHPPPAGPQHGSYGQHTAHASPHQMNGIPLGPVQPSPPIGLSSLRPPPSTVPPPVSMSSPHHTGGHGMMGSGGVTSSPHHVVSTMAGQGAYASHHYHPPPHAAHPTHSSPHHLHGLTNGVGPAAPPQHMSPRSGDPFAQGLLPPRQPFGPTAHGSHLLATDGRVDGPPPPHQAPPLAAPAPSSHNQGNRRPPTNAMSVSSLLS